MPIFNILKSLLEIIKKMSLKDILLTILVLAFIIVAWKANVYRNNAIKFEAQYEASQKALKIEKGNLKLKENIKKMRLLQSTINKQNTELVTLYGELKKLSSIRNTRTEIMEELDLEDTKGICEAFADIGYPICGKF